MAVKIFQVPGLRIKSIQRGVTAIATGQTAGTTTISSVDTAKSIINQQGQSAGGSTGTDVYGGYVVITDSTTITATRLTTVGAATNIAWEVIEFY